MALLPLLAGHHDCARRSEVKDGEDPARQGEIFNLARADNPFRDYSFI